MARAMLGPFLLVAASISPAQPALPPARQGAASFHPASGVTAHATVSIRIVSGVRFGDGQLGEASPGARRTAEISEPDGTVRAAELLEFQ